MIVGEVVSSEILRPLIAQTRNLVISNSPDLKDYRLSKPRCIDGHFIYWVQHWHPITKIEIYTRFDKYFLEVYDTLKPYLQQSGLPFTFRGTCYGTNIPAKFEDHVCYLMISAPEVAAPAYNPKALVINWYFEQMGSPYAVWDQNRGWFTKTNLVLCPWHSMVDQVRKLNPLQQVGLLPYRYDPSLVRLSEFPTDKDIDVLFAGHPNERRTQLRHKLEATGLKVVFVDTVFGLELDRLIVRAKINLNLHYYPGAFLEIHRINRLLAYGACVVSEYSDDPDTDAEYEPYVHFGKIDDLVETVVGILGGESSPKENFHTSKSMTQEMLDTFDRFVKC